MARSIVCTSDVMRASSAAACSPVPACRGLGRIRGNRRADRTEPTGVGDTGLDGGLRQPALDRRVARRVRGPRPRREAGRGFVDRSSIADHTVLRAGGGGRARAGESGRDTDRPTTAVVAPRLERGLPHAILGGLGNIKGATSGGSSLPSSRRSAPAMSRPAIAMQWASC